MLERVLVFQSTSEFVSAPALWQDPMVFFQTHLLLECQHSCLAASRIPFPNLHYSMPNVAMSFLEKLVGSHGPWVVSSNIEPAPNVPHGRQSANR